MEALHKTPHSDINRTVVEAKYLDGRCKYLYNKYRMFIMQ